jgi:hypothetical protein
MSEAIKKSDVVQGEPFNDIAKEMQATILVLEKFDTGVKNVAKSLELISKESKTTVQGINNITQAEKESQKLVQQKMQNDKALEKMRLEEIRIQKAREKSIDDYNRKAAKEEAQAKKNASAYNQLAKSTRDLKNQSKDLGATMLKLEADGKKNTEQYRKLAAQYKDVTRAAQQGDAQLKKLDKTVGDNFRNVGNYEKAVGGLKTALGALGVAFGARQLISFGTESMELFRIQQKAIAQVEAGLKSTGNQAGFTSQQLQTMASDLQKTTLFGDETILKDATAQLLTFTNITGEQFDRTQKAALDLATRLDGDLKSASIQLGKALNDPIKGLSALAKSGIQFSASQKETITTLTESGRLVEAQTLILDELNKQYGGSAEAAAKADGGITQLSNAWGDAKEMLGGLIVDAIRPATQGLLDFFSAITVGDIKSFLSIIGKLLKTFIAYKAVMFSMKMADRIKEMIAYNKAVKDGSVVAGGATEGVKKFGAALKGIGLGLAIGLALELAQAFWDIASGAKYAREEKERMDKAMAAGTSSAEKVLAKSNENLKEQLRLLDLEIRERKANGEDEKKLTKEKVEREKQLTEAEFKGINNRIKFKENALSRQLQLEDKLRAATTIGLKPGEYEAVNKELSELYGINTKGVVNYGKALLKVSAATTRITQEIVELNEGKKELSKLTQDLNVQVIEETAAVKEDTKEKKSSTRAIKEKTKAMKDANDQINHTLAVMKETQALTDEIAAYEAEQNIQAAIQAQLDSIEKTGRYSLEVINMLIDAEYELQKAILDRQYMEAIENAGSEQEVINAQMRYNHEIDKLEKEREEKHKDTREQLEQQQEDWVEKTREQTKEEENALKERYDTINRVQQAITDVLQEQIDRRIALLQKEADAAKNQQDYLQDLAANGNITAQQSIAEQIQIQREAQAEQMRLEKQKQQIELISQGLSTFNAELGAGKSPAQALASTIVSTQALVGFLRNLNFYEKGTDNAPGGVSVVDEKGAEIITDKQGRIKDIGTGEGARFVNLSKGDKVITATKTAQILNAFGNVQNGTMIGKGKEVAGNSYDIMKLNTGLNRIEQAIKNKPEYQVHWDTFGTVERVRKGGDIVTNRYRVK